MKCRINGSVEANEADRYDPHRRAWNCIYTDSVVSRNLVTVKPTY